MSAPANRRKMMEIFECGVPLWVFVLSVVGSNVISNWVWRKKFKRLVENFEFVISLHDNFKKFIRNRTQLTQHKEVMDDFEKFVSGQDSALYSYLERKDGQG